MQWIPYSFSTYPPPILMHFSMRLHQFSKTGRRPSFSRSHINAEAALTSSSTLSKWRPRRGCVICRKSQKSRARSGEYGGWGICGMLRCCKYSCTILAGCSPIVTAACFELLHQASREYPDMLAHWWFHPVGPCADRKCPRCRRIMLPSPCLHYCIGVVSQVSDRCCASRPSIAVWFPGHRHAAIPRPRLRFCAKTPALQPSSAAALASCPCKLPTLILVDGALGVWAPILSTHDSYQVLHAKWYDSCWLRYHQVLQSCLLLVGGFQHNGYHSGDSLLVGGGARSASSLIIFTAFTKTSMPLENLCFSESLDHMRSVKVHEFQLLSCLISRKI